jgi:hypothetical protein
MIHGNTFLRVQLDHQALSVAQYGLKGSLACTLLNYLLNCGKLNAIVSYILEVRGSMYMVENWPFQV